MIRSAIFARSAHTIRANRFASQIVFHSLIALAVNSTSLGYSNVSSVVAAATQMQLLRFDAKTISI
jgi:hypothetical protein